MAVGKSGDNVVSQVAFYGGKGTDRKISIKNGFADAECLDFRKSPSQMSVLPAPRVLGATASQVIATEQTPDGVIWCLCANGHLYKYDVNGNFSWVLTIPTFGNGVNGDIAYWKQTDSLYITGAADVYRYSNVTSGATSAITRLSAAYSTYPTVFNILIRDRDNKWIGGPISRWSFLNSSSGSYSVPTSLSEADTHKCIFLPDVSPMTKIAVKFTAKPASGNITLTVHNVADEVVATKTLTAAQVSTSTVTNFTFDQPVNLGNYKHFGSEYHIHLTATVAGFSAEVYESAKLYGLHFFYYASLLYNTVRKSHQIEMWNDQTGPALAITNGQYVATWIPSGNANLDVYEFQRHRIEIGNGIEATSLTSNDEYLVIGGERVSSAPHRTPQEGIIAFWDGFADNLNFKEKISIGEPKSLFNHNNIVYMIIGGALYAYTGAKSLIRVRTIDGSQTEFSGVADRTTVYPQMMAVRRGVLMVAFPTSTNVPDMRFGIYSWGSIDKNYPNSFGYNYKLSPTENKNTDGTTFNLGGVWSFGDTLLYSVSRLVGSTWTHNLMVVDNSSKPAPTYSFESLVYDSGRPLKDKMALRVGISFRKPLASGVVITPKIKVDDGDWILSPISATEGSRDIYFEINKRFREIQFGFDGTADNTTTVSPEITEISLDARELSEETKMGAHNG